MTDLRLLAVDSECLVYTGDLKEEGYLEFFSHETKEVIRRQEFPGEAIYATEFFADGLILAHLPMQILNQGNRESAPTDNALKLSFLSAEGDLVELWQAKPFYPMSIFHMSRIGDKLIFALDEEIDEEPGGHVARIGLIAPDKTLSWLLDEKVPAGEGSQQLSVQPITVGNNRVIVRYQLGDESVLYEYDSTDGALHDISLPETSVQYVYPMKDGNILFATVAPPPVDGYQYFLLSPARVTEEIDLPQEWKLQQLLPLGAEDNLWSFVYGRDLSPTFIGSKLDQFASATIIEAFKEANESDSALEDFPGHFLSFEKDGQVYLVETDRSSWDIQVKKINVEIAPFKETVENSETEISQTPDPADEPVSETTTEATTEAPATEPPVVDPEAPTTEPPLAETEVPTMEPPVEETDMPLQGGSIEEGQAWLNEQENQNSQEADPAPQNPQPVGGAKSVLSVPLQLQREWYWCAPTTVSMMLASRGVEADQAELATAMGTAQPFGTHNVNAVSVLNTYLFGYEWPGDGQAGYRLATVTTADPSSDEAALFKQRFKQNIDDGYPMYLTFDIAHIYPGRSGEHNVPGIGYQMNEDNTDIAYIYYLDPLPSVQDPVYGGLMKVTPYEFMNAMLTCVEPNYGW